MECFEQQDLFISGEGGYARYRIPALAIVPRAHYWLSARRASSRAGILIRLTYSCAAVSTTVRPSRRSK
jgi:hypothetical protein